MEVDNVTDVKNELPTPPASDVGSPTSFSQCGSDSEPDSPMVEDTKVCSFYLVFTQNKMSFISKIKAAFSLLLWVAQIIFFFAAKCWHDEPDSSRR